jgi:IclR family acetate operon transcriptional repressor
MARTGLPATRRIAAVERAVALLDALAAGDPDLGTNELARRTGINASTVSRLLATLIDGGLVEHVPSTGRYRLGPRLLTLGNAVTARLDVREIARPHLVSLATRTGETVTLSAPGDPDAITVDFVQSPSSVQSVAQLGRPSVAHATAAGKVALAFGALSPPSGPLIAYTERTIIDPARLATELERTRRRGWAEAVEERELELAALAAPIFGADGRLAAIVGVQGPASRFDTRARRAARPPLLDCGDEVSRKLGWGLSRQ